MMNNECLVVMTLGQAGRLELDVESSALFGRNVILFAITRCVRVLTLPSLSLALSAHSAILTVSHALQNSN